MIVNNGQADAASLLSDQTIGSNGIHLQAGSNDGTKARERIKGWVARNTWITENPKSRTCLPSSVFLPTPTPATLG
jgi:hypothetical protein